MTTRHVASEPPAASSGQATGQPGAPPEPGTDARLASASHKELDAASRAIVALMWGHRDLLPPPLFTSLRELNARLSEQLCPYPAEQLDARIKELNEQFSDYEHWYIRCGTTVTWCDRRKDKPPA